MKQLLLSLQGAINARPWLRNVTIILGCLLAAMIFPVTIYAGVWALIGLLTMWPSVWCLFTIATVSAAAIPGLVYALAHHLDTDVSDFKSHPVLFTAYAALLTGLTFMSYLYLMLTIQLVPILGLAALALGLGAWVAVAVISEVSAADAVEIKGTAGLAQPAPIANDTEAVEHDAPKRTSRLAEILSQPVPVC